MSSQKNLWRKHWLRRKQGIMAVPRLRSFTYRHKPTGQIKERYE